MLSSFGYLVSAVLSVVLLCSIYWQILSPLYSDGDRIGSLDRGVRGERGPPEPWRARDIRKDLLEEPAVSSPPVGCMCVEYRCAKR